MNVFVFIKTHRIGCSAGVNGDFARFSGPSKYQGFPYSEIAKPGISWCGRRPVGFAVILKNVGR